MQNRAKAARLTGYMGHGPVGRGSDELFSITKNFVADWFAMAEYLRLEDRQKAVLLESDELISQISIKALKGTRLGKL